MFCDGDLGIIIMDSFDFPLVWIKTGIFNFQELTYGHSDQSSPRPQTPFWNYPDAGVMGFVLNIGDGFTCCPDYKNTFQFY